MGDRAVLVRGSLKYLGKEIENSCNLTIHEASSGKPVHTRKVESHFDVAFVLEPKKKPYYFTIECPSYSPEYRSSVFDLGQRSSAFKTFDLGTISFPKGP